MSELMQGFEEKFHEKLLKIAYEHLKLSSLAIAGNAIVLGFILSPYVTFSHLAIWISLMIGISLYRFKSAKEFEKNPNQKSMKQWEKNFYIALFISSFLWSLVPFLFFVADNYLIQAAILVLIAGLSAGAISALSSLTKAFNLFSFMLLVPLIIVLLMQQTHIHLGMAAFLTLYLIMILIVGRRFNGNYKSVLEVKVIYENEREKFTASNERFETLFKNAPVGIFFYGADLILKEVNQKFMDFLEAPEEFLVGLDMTTLQDKRILPTLKLPFEDAYGLYEGEYMTHCKSKGLYISMKTSPLRDSSRNIIGAIGIVSDITETMLSQQRIEHQAKYDALTNIANRLTLKERIEREIIRYKQHRVLFAILFLDLDHFKNINDSLGHAVGDALLIEVAKKLQSIVRVEDTVARIGGDEFVILMPDLSLDAKAAANDAEHLALQVAYVLNQPVLIDGHELSLSSSIGITLISKDDTSDDLLKHADIAMYQAKNDGRGTTRFYQHTMDVWVKRRLELENGLRNALFNNELEVYYQPIVDCSTLEIIGAEALLRWNSKEFGFISPSEFIPVAEESGLIIQIGEFVLKEALTQFVMWKREVASAQSLMKIAINISVRQFKMPNFVTHLQHAIDFSGIEARHVELEIVESIIIDDVNKAKEKMQHIRELGVDLSIDDFGTGYSSLLYIKQLPFTTLKIDRSFVQDIDNDEDDKELIETVINIAKKFNLKVVAEGVETELQHEFLASKSCDYYQGFLCSPALKSEDFIKLLNLKTHGM